MHIMTANGWRQLSPTNCSPAIEPRPSNGVPAPYTGKFPSQSLCDLFNHMQEELLYFDNGIRMVYGRADKQVPTDNAAAANPIKYPPKGF